MPEYKVIGLLYTRACPLACAHCITESSPQAKERMRLREARDYLPAIAGFGAQLCFTGGEPFLHYKEIAELIREAKRLGLHVSLVTGAGWARTEATMRARLLTLVEAGLDGLCISWDRYHEAFAKADGAATLAKIAADLGVKVNVRAVVAAKGDMDAYHKTFDGLPVSPDGHEVIRLGRAMSLPEEHFSFEEEPPRGVCNTVFSPVVEPDGNVYVCCGPARFCRRPSPLLLGNAREEPLERILSRALEDPILEIIYNLGPYGLYHLLKSHAADMSAFTRRAKYTGICELCLDITDSPELVRALREILNGREASRLLAVSRLWRNAAFGAAQQPAPG